MEYGPAIWGEGDFIEHEKKKKKKNTAQGYIYLTDLRGLDSTNQEGRLGLRQYPSSTKNKNLTSLFRPKNYLQKNPKNIRMRRNSLSISQGNAILTPEPRG
jgi:hypothetical protein